MSRFKAHDPGAPLWWIGYLLWKWFGLCRVGHTKVVVRADKDCDLFWWAELDLLDFMRHPEHWKEEGLTEVPPFD
jgi:hypothetical protein